MKTSESSSAPAAVRALFAYRYARVILASLMGCAILFAGFVHGRGTGRGSDLAWFLVVFMACQLLAYRGYRRVRAAEDELHFEAALARREARLAAERERSGPNVVGKKCKACDHRIVIAHDGCRCETCSAPLHVDCRTAHRAEVHTREGAYR
jgi:hypothetical protein